MTDRRRRLIKYMFKKEGRLDQFEVQYPVTIRRKDEVIHRFSSLQLEELLNNSTKNVAQEVVTCLIPKKGEGVLVLIEQQHSDSLMHQTTAQSTKDQSKDNTQLYTDENAAFADAQRRDQSPQQLQEERTRPQFVAPHEYQQPNHNF